MLVRLTHLADEGGFDVFAWVELLDPVKRFECCFCEKLPSVDSFSASELGHAYGNDAGQGLGTQVYQETSTRPFLK